MNIIIVGCGKVGARLATMLDEDGHDVSVVDRDADSFSLLDSDFGGFKTCGIPIDQEVLRNAGIENCDALAAVGPDDNVNIMVSQLAHEVFNVPITLARIYDPRREAVFSGFGMHTVCPTNLTVAAVRSAITEVDKPQLINLESHTVHFTTQHVPKALVGTLASDLIFPDKNNYIYGILHENSNLTIYQGQQIRFVPNDKVIVSTIVD